jgi:hypothetical protein
MTSQYGSPPGGVDKIPNMLINSAEGNALKVMDVRAPKVEPPPYCILETLNPISSN